MADPADDIMNATFRALCEHGYADLTMRDIAEESDRSKAALHYHYDDKEGLMLAFLDHLYNRFLERVREDSLAGSASDGASEAVDDPDEELRAFLSAALHPRHDDARQFRTALLEIKAQAPYEDGFRERIARFDELVAETVTDLVVAGQEAGVYRDGVDPDHVAQFVLVVLDGAGTRHVVADAPVDCAIGSLEDYLDGHLLVDGRERSTGGSDESGGVDEAFDDVDKADEESEGSR